MSHTDHPVLHKMHFAIDNCDITARARGGLIWRGVSRVRHISLTPLSQQRRIETLRNVSCTSGLLDLIRMCLLLCTERNSEASYIISCVQLGGGKSIDFLLISYNLADMPPWAH